jgi:hypothetical protein
MHVHLFRHLPAKLHLESYPEDIETARRILGHQNVTTILRSYAETKTAAAFHRYDELIPVYAEPERCVGTIDEFKLRSVVANCGIGFYLRLWFHTQSGGSLDYRRRFSMAMLQVACHEDGAAC